MKINVLRTADEFEALKPQWDVLVKQSPNSSVFLTWEWQYYWWKYYAGTGDLFLITCIKNNQICGIAPFYVDHKKRLRIMDDRVLRFVGTGRDTSPDYLDIIALPEDYAECSTVVIDFIFDQGKSWDTFDCQDMTETSLFQQKLTQAIESNPNLLVKQRHSQIMHQELPPTWDEYRNSLSSSRRRTINRKRNAFNKAGNLEFGYCKSPEEFDEVFDQLVLLHTERWEDKSSTSFQTDEYLGFHRNVIHQLDKIGSAQLTYLRLDGEYIAVNYWYIWNGTMFFFQGGFSSECQHLSPGLVLLCYSIEFAIGQGMTEIDMLKGEHDYKASYAKELKSIISIECCHRSILTQALAQLRRFKKFLKNDAASLPH